VTNGNEDQCEEEEEKARRFLIKIRFGFPPLRRFALPGML